MPAMLAVLGHRVDALSVRPLTRRLVPWTARDTNVGHPGVWFRISDSVMRRPAEIVVTFPAPAAAPDQQQALADYLFGLPRCRECRRPN